MNMINVFLISILTIISFSFAEWDPFYVPDTKYHKVDCKGLFDSLIADMKKLSVNKEGINKVKKMLGTKSKQSNFVCYIELGSDADSYTAIKDDFSAFILKTKKGFQIGDEYGIYGPTIYRYYEDGFKEDAVWEDADRVSNKSKSIRESVKNNKKLDLFWMGN